MFLSTQVIGYLGKDCYLSEHNGKKVINFTVAYTEKFKNAQGVEVESTVWIECSMWEKEKIAPYLKKGTQIMAIGKPKAQSYVSKEGEPKAALKLAVMQLQLLGAAKKETGTTAAQATTAATPPAPVANDGNDLPF